jgi:hypothetical protein
MIKTRKGGVAFWLLGTAGVVMATWEFAMIVAG